MFRKRGTPLTVDQFATFGGRLLTAIPRDLPSESIEYWSRNTQQLSMLMREVLFKPGTRILSVPQDFSLETLHPMDVEHIEHDCRTRSLTELDLSKVKILHLDKDKAQIANWDGKYLPLGAHALSVLLANQQALPLAWKKLDSGGTSYLRIRFEGTRCAKSEFGLCLGYEHRDPDRGWYCHTEPINSHHRLTAAIEI